MPCGSKHCHPRTRTTQVCGGRAGQPTWPSPHFVPSFGSSLSLWFISTLRERHTVPTRSLTSTEPEGNSPFPPPPGCAPARRAAAAARPPRPSPHSSSGSSRSHRAPPRALSAVGAAGLCGSPPGDRETHTGQRRGRAGGEARGGLGDVTALSGGGRVVLLPGQPPPSPPPRAGWGGRRAGAAAPAMRSRPGWRRRPRRALPGLRRGPMGRRG